MSEYVDATRVVEAHTESDPSSAPIILGEARYFRGCNIYHSRPVIRQIVYGASRADESFWIRGSDFRSAFQERFENLPSFTPTRLRMATLAERFNGQNAVGLDELLLEAIISVEEAVALSARNFEPIQFALVKRDDDYSALVWQTAFPVLSRAAAEVAARGVLELLPNAGEQGAGRPETDFDTSLKRLLRRARRRRMLDTPALMKFVAQQKGLPVERVTADKMRIGHGRFQQHVISSMTNETSAVAQKFCWDKTLANRMLSDLGLPVPRQVEVSSAQAAYDQARDMGCAVVIKPARQSNGAGASVNISTFPEIDAAFQRAKAYDPKVVVEEFVPGFVHRLLVVGGKFSAALRFQRPSVIGDGEKNIQELINDLNMDPRRDGIRTKKIEYDDDIEYTLKSLGLNRTSIPPAGEEIFLRSISSMASGAISIDCTDLVHQDNRVLAERAAAAFGSLAAAGIDFATPDISQSYKDVGGRIIEVNSSPGLLMHEWPGEGTSRPMAAKVLDLLYPVEGGGRIPIAVVAGDRGPGTPARILDALLQKCGRASALSLRQEAFVCGHPVAPRYGKRRVLLEHLLSNLVVDALVASVSLRQIARRGLCMDGCTVSIILDRMKEGNAVDFHNGISVLGRATTDAFVVGSGNQVVLENLKGIEQRKLILVADRLTDPPVREHLENGGIVIADKWASGENRFIIMMGSEEIGQVPIGDLWSRLPKGKAIKMRQATKYAVAGALGLGLAVAEISTALKAAATIAGNGSSTALP